MASKNIIWNSLVIVILFFFVIINILPAIKSNEFEFTPIIKTTENIFYVDDNFNESTSGWNDTHFNKIQSALNVTSDNDIIYVFEGNYQENIEIKNKVELYGGFEGGNSIIDGGNYTNVVLINSDQVRIDGFSIMNSGSEKYELVVYDAGIRINSDYNIIINNIIMDNMQGILLFNSNNNVINNNTLQNNKLDQIAIIKKSNFNKIISNSCDNNIQIGIFVLNSNNNYIKDNTINLTSIGIYLVDRSSNNILNNNTIKNIFLNPGYDTGDGILIEWLCWNNKIIWNDLEKCDKNGLLIRVYSYFNNINYNDFKNNSRNAFFENSYLNYWNQNYWDDLNGKEIYTISGRFNNIPLRRFDTSPSIDEND